MPHSKRPFGTKLHIPLQKNQKTKKPNTTNNNQFLASSLLPPPSCCQTEKIISFFSSHGNFCTERKLRCEPLCIPKDFRMNSVCRCGIVTGPGAWEQFRYSQVILSQPEGNLRWTGRLTVLEIRQMVSLFSDMTQFSLTVSKIKNQKFKNQNLTECVFPYLKSQHFFFLSLF